MLGNNEAQGEESRAWLPGDALLAQMLICGCLSHQGKWELCLYFIIPSYKAFLTTSTNKKEMLYVFYCTMIKSNEDLLYII